MQKSSIVSEEDINYFCSIIVLCAGGTINMSGKTECKPGGGVGKALNSIDDKLKKMGITYMFENVFDRPPDSSNVGEDEWEKIIDKIREVVDKKEAIRKKLLNKGIKREVGGVVVAHGTDTLHITTLVVALEFSLSKLTLPIVFTASYATMDAPNSDAPDNLLKSLFCAKERFNRQENLVPGIYVIIGSDIHLASRLTKVCTMPNDDSKYFYSFPSPVGQISSDKSNTFHFKFNNNYLSGLTSGIKLDRSEVTNDKPWGIVEHIYLDALVTIIVVEDLVRRIHHYQSHKENQGRSFGVVIQGDFSNNRSFLRIAEQIRALCNDGVVVLIGSKQSFEALLTLAKIESDYLCLIHKSMSHLKAKIKLGWLLKSNLPAKRIKQLMETNIAGEVFQTEMLPEWIRFEAFHNYTGKTEVVIAYPNIHPRVLQDAVDRLLSYHTADCKLYLYGFGDGHFPATNASIAQLVKDFTRNHWDRELNVSQDASLAEIIERLNHYVQENSFHLASYFTERFELSSENTYRNKVRAFVHSELCIEKRKELSEKVYGFFVPLREDPSIMISYPDIQLRMLMNTLVNSIKVEPDQTELENRVSEILDEVGSEFSRIKKMYVFLSKYYPTPLSKRILKEAVMESNENMRIIGTAIDNHIGVIVKTLAVKSQSNIARYEIGNMLMVLGVDSDITKGYKSDYFFPKAKQ